MSISLKAIKLFNFKSFRGKVIIENIQSFTAIIGPNGSEKSNIMDAISFVLGETLSTLRVKHLNELVHGAVIGKPAVEGAYVTIVLIKDQIEKSYTRTIQGKSSHYKIDNKIVTRDIYMSELKEFGLDIKAGNFLMPQGYIQYFATPNMSKELTMMFEEISGSNVYKAEYDRLQLELSKEKQDVQFAYQIKKTQLRQRKSAMIEKTEAEKYLQLQEQYMKEKLKFQLIQLIFIKKTVESLRNEQKEIKRHMAKYLWNKEIKTSSLNRTTLEVKSLFALLNKTEEIILKLENDIQRGKLKHVDIESNTLHWKKKLELDDRRSQVGIASKLYLENQKAYMLIQMKIKQQKQKCEDILRECKLEGIIIPTLSEISYDVSSSNSNISTESNVWEVMMNIDFSQISNHIKSNTTHLQNIIEQSKIKLTEIQNKYKALRKPDLKADTKVDSIKQQIKETNEKYQELRIKFNHTSKQFEIVKTKRHKSFSNCLEHITDDIDTTYKNLTYDQSAQALIILENPEEPYMGGINYSCIPPSKRYQPLQYLSDGEKTIANLAFRFSMLRYKPTFFIMDEGDAALESNIKKLVNYMRSQMKNTQAIAITSNTNLSSHANMLIGVATQPNTACTESVIFTVQL